MKPIAVFYHGLLMLGDPPELLPSAIGIMAEQMSALASSGLLSHVDFMLAGINGGEESRKQADALLPDQSQKVYHGLDSRSENLTLVQLEEWLPGHEDWNVLYFHCKGATHPAGHKHTTEWRTCMMHHLVKNWSRCVKDLEAYDSVGCHWLVPPITPAGQHIWAGNFWWATGSYLATLPSIMERDRIKISGIGALESRYEAEVWIGNGPRLPRVRDYHPANASKRGACEKIVEVT